MVSQHLSPIDLDSASKSQLCISLELIEPSRAKQSVEQLPLPQEASGQPHSPSLVMAGRHLNLPDPDSEHQLSMIVNGSLVRASGPRKGRRKQKRQLKIVIDSGSTHSCISKSFATRLSSIVVAMFT